MPIISLSIATTTHKYILAIPYMQTRRDREPRHWTDIIHVFYVYTIEWEDMLLNSSAAWTQICVDIGVIIYTCDHSFFPMHTSLQCCRRGATVADGYLCEKCVCCTVHLNHHPCILRVIHTNTVTHVRLWVLLIAKIVKRHNGLHYCILLVKTIEKHIYGLSHFESR